MVKQKNVNLGKGKISISLMPYSEIVHLDSAQWIKKLLAIVLAGKVVVLQGQLKPEEESRLIEDTMALIGHVKDFRGIELAVLTNEVIGWTERFKNGIAKMLVGQRDALTVIGPASLVKEIKKNPQKLEIMFN